MTRTSLAILFIALILATHCKAVSVGQYVLTDLGDLPGGNDESYATGINNYGEVVGWSGTDTVTRGFLWSPNAPNSPTGSIVDLGSLRSDGQSYAYGINNLGQIVGRTAGNPANEAFLWTPTVPNGNSGAMSIISGSPFQEGFSLAYGLNDDGQIVGYGQTPGGNRGFIWAPDSPSGNSGSIKSIEPPNGGISVHLISVRPAK